MKRIVLLVALSLALTIVATVGAARSFTAKAPIPVRVATLEAKVKALTARVKRDEAATSGKLACLQWIGMTEYGNPTLNNGYIYTPDGGATSFLTSAADFTAQGDTPSAYVVTIPKDCTGTKSFERAAPLRSANQAPDLGRTALLRAGGR